MKRALIGAGIALLVAAAAAGGAWLWFVDRMTSPIGEAEPVEVVIEDGAGWDRAAIVLAEHGLNPNPPLFDLWARIRGGRVALKAGVFRLDRSMSSDEIMEQLAAGPAKAAPPLALQIIPGMNVWQVAARLEALGLDGLLDVASDPELIRSLDLPAPRRTPPGAHTLLEGYLAPETYHLDRKRPSLKAALRRTAAQFRADFAALKGKHAPSIGRLIARHRLTEHDFVILASLVEKEVAALEEAPLVAGVFYNRLAKGMKLQTDPTMVYGPTTWREKPSPRFRRDPANPYNTYQHEGLPPGPICSPSLASLEAAMDPADTEAIYFVARRDGTGRHAFSKTLDGHQANIDRYLK